MLDASAIVGSWPFLDTTGNTLESLAAKLTEVGVRGAALAPAESILHPEPMAGNRRLIAAARAYRGPLAAHLTPIIDPSLPIWREHLDACVREGGPALAGIKILPNYHVYPADSAPVHELAEALEARGLTLCIQVRMFDERSHHRLMRVPPVAAAEIVRLASAHPRLPILVCGPYIRELSEYKAAPNVSAEMSFVESGRTLQEALAALGPDRLLMGTHAPLLYPAAGVAKVDADDLPAGDRLKLAEGNFRRVFRRAFPG